MEPAETLGGRERLLRAANILFRTGAYRDVSIAQILAHAGVQPPTLYHHFGDKESLFVEWALGAMRGLGERIRDAAANPFDPIEALIACARALAANDRLDLLQTLRDIDALQSPAHRESLLGTYLAEVHEPICSVLLRAAERGFIRPEPLSRTAALFLMGAVALSASSPLPGAATSDPEWWVRRFLRGFAPLGEGSSPGRPNP
ncbi:MAG: TetR/AcrR family transcriptional regulator [Fimbriimonadaceae bacterium]